MHNWLRYPSSNWYEIDQKRGTKFGALLWRQLTPRRKTAILVHNYDPSCIQLLKKDFGNLLPVGLLVRTNLFIPSRFWTTNTKFDNCCLHYVPTCGIFLYMCTSTFSALNYCGEIFFKFLSYLHEMVRTNLSVDFWTFRNFWPRLRNHCGATQQQKWERTINSEKTAENRIKINP